MIQDCSCYVKGFFLFWGVIMIEFTVMTAFFGISLYLLFRDGLLSEPWRVLLSVTALLIAFGFRFLSLPYETLDYQNFLTRWVYYFRTNGGFRALKDSVGNYNVPYLYFLAAFSYTDYSDLYLIKYLSIAFDILLAWAVMKLVGLFRKESAVRIGAFCGTLLLPTVMLNGAYWGQCDSVYVALALVSVWCALADRPRLSLVFITLSFAFKLQAVFFMPVFFVLCDSERIRWRDLWIPPVTYLLTVLPAVLLGRPLLSTLTLYFSQAGTVGDGLNYNSPSLFAFYTGGGNEEALARYGIIAAFAFCAVLLAALILRDSGQDNRALLLAFALTAICVPLLLPHMHDRYFYGADVLGFVLAFLGSELLPVPFLCSFASLLGYHAYLRQRYLFPMRYGTVALLIAAALICVSGFLRNGQNNSEKKQKSA